MCVTAYRVLSASDAVLLDAESLGVDSVVMFSDVTVRLQDQTLREVASFFDSKPAAASRCCNKALSAAVCAGTELYYQWP